MTTETSISVIIPHDVTEQQFSSLLDDLRSGHIDAVIIQRKTQEFFASIDLTAIVFLITGLFFTGIVNKLGEDVYTVLKRSFVNQWGKFFGPKPEIKMLRVGPGGIIKESIFCISISIKGVTAQGTKWTLLFLNETSQEDFDLAIEKFVRLLLDNHATLGEDPLSVLLESGESHLKHLKPSIYLDPTSKKLVLIDPVQSSIQKTPTGYEIPDL